MSKSLKRVRAALENAGLAARIVEMPGSTRTAAEAATEVGCALDQIAKSIIFQNAESGEICLFLTAGGNQVDAEKAAGLVGAALIRADAQVVRSQTGFAIGGVAPIGHLNPVRAYFDPRLSDFDEVWAAAGTPRHVFAIAPATLLALTGAEVAEFVS